ncbi:hypothetical protein C0Q70_19798 [Pomacea canaliculata]|uniref:Uncharacterized protein n=2 Tax=Pomacea canaliculata TaxID=400727 RepID=A0A2T7NDR7_POMCA|nr:hypothetical protein C0Q70_19798 [Pomacea canaliculata]
MQSLFPVGNFTMTDEEVWEDPTWSRLFAYMEARKIVDVLCMSHFACYFFVYYLTGKHFRRELTYLITCHGKFQFFGAFATKTHKGDRYSMVSSNGHTMATETCTTAYTTSM